MSTKDLLGIEELSAADITAYLDEADAFKRRSPRRRSELKDKTVALVFYENSTRTRSSFELAAKRLSAEVLALPVQASSVAKGENLLDTLRTVEAMGVDLFVLRHPDSGAARLAARGLRVPLVNAGDGTHEHPTQALLDLHTLREKKGRLAGLKVVYVGDILHSRVARSGIFGLTKLGARVAVCGPPTLVPEAAASLGAEVHHDLRRALKDADAVVALRLQLERQKENLLPSIAEYASLYGLTAERLEWAKPDCLVMHPGPMNRGIEISDEVADGTRSAILAQVENGVYVRMAVLARLLSGKKARSKAAR